MKLEDFFTRPNAEIPKKWILHTIEGVKTNEYLMLLGTESGAFQAAKTVYMRECLEGQDDPEFDKVMSFAKFTASLVHSWSFDAEFTQEAVIDFLYKAPYICVGIDNFASVLGNKAEETKKPSAPTRRKRSNSTSRSS